MNVYFLMAVRNLLQARRRTTLMCIALVSVTMLLVLLMALSAGLSDSMITTATTLAAGHVNIGGLYKAKSTDVLPIMSGAGEVQKIVEANTPNLDFILDRHRGWVRIVSPTGSMQALGWGIDAEKEERFLRTVRVVDGELAHLRDPHTVLLFGFQAKKLGVKAGDQITLTVETANGTRNTTDLTVAAIGEDKGLLTSWSIYFPRADFLELYRFQPDTTGELMIYLKDLRGADATVAHLGKVFREKGYRLEHYDPRAFFLKLEAVAAEDWTGQRLDITTWRDEISFRTWVLDAVEAISGLLLAILVVIIVIGIADSMWISVRERTGEIGTLRAIGMGRARILGMIMLEALLLGAAATSFGALLGTSIALAIDTAELPLPIDALRSLLMSDRLHLLIRPSGVLAAIAVFTGAAALSALLPALKASRMQPVTAIQHVT